MSLFLREDMHINYLILIIIVNILKNRSNGSDHMKRRRKILLKNFFHGLSLILMLVTSGCHQNSVNFIAGSNLTRNKPTNQGDGKRPSEEGEGLIGYLNSPDAVHGAKNGNQIEFFGNAGAILSTTGTPKDLDVCALSIGENLEEMGSKSQSYPILASTKALDDGSFRLSIPESNLASVGIMGLDVSGKCLAMDFRPSNGRRTSFVMGSASSGWRFIRAPSQQNALTKKPKSQSSDDDFLSTDFLN
jgi:hypothetical protein